MQNAPRDMDREDIKAAIRKTGITLNELSLRHGYTITAVRTALRRQWPAVEAIVAKALGKNAKDIWPSRYDAAGAPLRQPRRTGADTSRTRRASHRQKQEAA